MTRSVSVCALAGAVILALASADAAAPEWGGLVERWAWPESGGNLVANGDFRELGADGKPAAWKFNTDAWSVVDVGGAKALRLKDSDRQQYYSIASTAVETAPGYYSISAKVRTVGITRGSARIQVVPGSTGNLLSKTSEGVSGARMFPIMATSARVEAYGWGKPDGEAYFRDVTLVRHESPRDEMFLLYPNYLGRLWADGPQTVRVAVRGAGPGRVVLRAGAVAREQPVTLTETWQTVSLDARDLAEGAYRLALETSGGNYRPEYAITKTRRQPAVRVDPDNVWVQPTAAGKPARRGLPVLVYHTSGYPPSTDGWLRLLSGFDELKYDIYLNYWMGRASLESLRALGRALAVRGRVYFDTVNDFYLPGPDTTPGGNHYPTGPRATPDAERTLARATGFRDQPGIGGWYTADELPASGFWGVWAQRKLLREHAPDLPTFGTQGNMTLDRLKRELELARDLLDIVSVDPYPVRGNNTNPDGSHKLEEVADFTAAAVAAVHDARPVWTTIQFWGNQDRAARGFRWPAKQELLDMSYLAVCAGARGLTYWSLGASALAYAPEGKRKELLRTLVEVVDEMKALDPVLQGEPVPVPVALAPGMIGVARKNGGTTTVIACNRTAAPVGEVRAYGQKVLKAPASASPPAPPGPAAISARIRHA